MKVIFACVMRFMSNWFYIMQHTQLVQLLMFGVRMNCETAGSKQQSFNATDIKNV